MLINHTAKLKIATININISIPTKVNQLYISYFMLCSQYEVLCGWSVAQKKTQFLVPF